MDPLTKRLLKELKACRAELNPEIKYLAPVTEDDLLNWGGCISGPPDTPYEGGQFELAIVIPPQYPMSPPVFTFKTRICHPNVHFKTGEICLDILKSAWSPAWTLQSTCTAISLLLAHPEPGSPLNCDAANLLRCNDTLGYNSLIQMYTKLYAMPAELEEN